MKAGCCSVCGEVCLSPSGYEPREAVVKGEGKLEEGGMTEEAGDAYCRGSATLRTSEIEGRDCLGPSCSAAPGFVGSEEIILEIGRCAGVG